MNILERLSSSHVRPPGPSGLPYLGSVFDYARDPLGFLVDTARTHGDIAYSRFGGADTFLVSHPDAIEHVLVKNRSNYGRDKFMARIKPLLGEGLLTADGELWKRQRKIMAPAFHRRKIAGYATTMVDCAQATAGGWSEGEIVEMNFEMMRLTLQIAVRTLFGADGSDDAQTVARAFGEVSEYFATVTAALLPLPLWVPTPKNRAFVEARDELDRIVYRILAQRRAASSSGHDLLGMLLEARDEDGQPMSDEQLRDEVITLLLAGHETTALALTYALRLLAQHPDVATELETEIDRVLAGRAPTLEDLDRLPFTDAVIKEAMRLYPPAAMISRQAIEEDEILGWRIPAQSIVTMAQWVVHRDPRFFDQPDNFMPHRWTPEFEAQLPKFAYFPFGGGQRICIGNAFAMMEAKLVLATLAGAWRCELLDRVPLELLPSVTIRPKRPVTMRMRRRTA